MVGDHPGIDRADVQRDMVHFTPGDHDQRIARGDWVYYVRAVRRGSSLTSSIGHGNDPLGLLLLLPLIGLWSLGQRWARWKVGVVRVPAASSWKTDRHRVVHREILEKQASPEARIGALVREVRAGRYDAA